MGEVSAEIDTFVENFIVWLDNGKPPRSNYGLPQYVSHKLGVVNHIPVCDTLEQLDAYFCSGTAQGSTHFGTGRPEYGRMQAFGYEFPASRCSQYMATVGPLAPWAQGIIQVCSSCPIPQGPLIRGMASGEPNPAFISIENTAMSGADGVTDAQFNSNVCLRVWVAQYFDTAITPVTQLWHSEVDSCDRCYDPGWPGSLEDELQNAARALLAGDASLMRQAVAVTPIPPEPEPEPEPPPVTDYAALYVAELRGELAGAQDDATRAQVRIATITAKLAAEGITV